MPDFPMFGGGFLAHVPPPTACQVRGFSALGPSQGRAVFCLGLGFLGEVVYIAPSPAWQAVWLVPESGVDVSAWLPTGSGC